VQRDSYPCKRFLSASSVPSIRAVNVPDLRGSIVTNSRAPRLGTEARLLLQRGGSARRLSPRTRQVVRKRWLGRKGAQTGKRSTISSVPRARNCVTRARKLVKFPRPLKLTALHLWPRYNGGCDLVQRSARNGAVCPSELVGMALGCPWTRPPG
jgi:hypothetical protein